MGYNEPSGRSPARLRRVKRLKKLIVASVLILIFVPLAMAIYFGCKAFSLQRKLADAREELDSFIEQMSESEFLESDSDIAESKPDSVPELSKEPEQSSGQNTLSYEDVLQLTLSDEELYDGYRKVYLTFDDGPSPNTERILDILKDYDVKATFFVVKRTGRNNEKIYRRIADEGHSLGMHSCTHVYRDLYKDTDSFCLDTNEIRNFLYLVTGVESDIYRFPGGSSNRTTSVDMHVYARELENMGIEFFDWNISSGDAGAVALTKDMIVGNVTSKLESFDNAVILFHDLSSKDSTVEALPEIIEYIQSMDNTVILPLTKETNPVQHLSVKDN